jgi:uncharacterized protein
MKLIWWATHPLTSKYVYADLRNLSGFEIRPVFFSPARLFLSADIRSTTGARRRVYPQITGTATVFPGEQDAIAILEEAFGMGLIGVKLHAHVQGFSMDSSGMHDIYQTCVKNGQPLVMHVGREPKSPVFSYPRDPYLLCSAKALEEVIRNYPKLRVCVPHMGADEYTDYRRLIEQYDNLWLDNAMILADYFPGQDVPHLSEMRCDRIMYGTDFPHLPYAWDRELKRLYELDLPDDSLAMILSENATKFFSVARD